MNKHRSEKRAELLRRVDKVAPRIALAYTPTPYLLVSVVDKFVKHCNEPRDLVQPFVHHEVGRTHSRERLLLLAT